MIKLLIAHGADPNLKAGFFKSTPLHEVCHGNCKNLEAIKFLVKHGADVHATDNRGSSLLHHACDRTYSGGRRAGCDMEVLSFLVKNGVDVNAWDHEGDTPMHIANHDIRAVKFLMDNGADINAENVGGETPLYHALFKNDDVEMTSARAMIELGAKVKSSLLYKACRYNDYRCDNYAEMITLLVKSGADLQTGENDGDTPLLQACKDHMAVSVRALMENGAKVHDKRKNGMTPLHHICDEYRGWSDYEYEEADDLQLAELLIRHGADCNAKDENGDAPLHLTTGEKLGIMELLMSKGADVNAQNNDGKTRLYLACEKGQLEVVQLLANRHGTNANTTTKDGVTPLQIASENGHLEIVWFLLKKYPWLISEHSE